MAKANDFVPNDDMYYQEIVDFVCDLTNCSKSEITVGTSLARDLGMEGDDAEEFFCQFEDKFSVDMSNFKFHDHFSDEPNAFSIFVALLKLLRVLPLEKRRPIYISDLCHAARTKVWPDLSHRSG